MPRIISVSFRFSVVPFLACLTYLSIETVVCAQTGTLQQVLQQVDSQLLANEARLRGDSRRGAIVFHTSAAACIKCHQSGEGKSPLGPDLARLGDKITDIHLVESLLLPSKSIREGFQTVQILTSDGPSRSGMLVRETEEIVVLRDAANLQEEITIAKDDIEARSNSKLSMMPDTFASDCPSLRKTEAEVRC